MSYTFGDDAPKTNPWEDDRLNYKPFAARLADTILKLHASNGYVLGLHGSWGMGKSTVMQFVRAFVEKHNKESSEKDQVLIVDFRPWMVAGHTDLVGAFFKVLSEALGESRKEGWRRRAKSFAKSAKGGVDPLIDATAKLALTAGSALVPGVNLIVAATKPSISKAIDKWVEEPSLQAAYETLRKQLAERETKILAFIDDIDRLLPGDIRAIMQMVKTVGQLPNITYLLAYDREIVWSALDEAVHSPEAHYAEKIVQHEVELPKPTVVSLLNALNSAIDFLPIDEKKVEKRPALLHSGIMRWIKSPRDVLRLSNALKFSWPALKEVIDPLDLVCMEGMRLFDRPVFDWIQASRGFLIGDGVEFIGKERVEAYGKTFADSLPSRTRDAQLRVISALFCSRAKVFGTWSPEAWTETVKRRGIAIAAVFDTYFSLYPDPGLVTATTLRTALAALDDEEIQLQTLRNFVDDPENGYELAADYLQQLRLRLTGEAAIKPTLSLLKALCAVGETIQTKMSDTKNFFAVSPYSQVRFLIEDMIAAWGQTEAGEQLRAALDCCNSVSFCCSVYVERAREMGVFKAVEGGRADLITQEALDAIGERSIAMILDARADASLYRAPCYFDVMRVWAHLRGVDEPREWLSSMVHQHPYAAATAAFGLLARSGAELSMSDGEIEPYYDLTVLKGACERHATATCLDDRQRQSLRALAAGLEKQSEGRSSTMPP